MCTVTFVPTSHDTFILTTNRDEAPSRSTKVLTTTNLSGRQIVFPKDARAGGTWVAASDLHQVICMLNGAFENHKRHPPYRRSRGLMALDYFSFKKTTHFFKQYAFVGMEPFTMIIYDRGQLWEVRWDEIQLHTQELSTTVPHIWASATLYGAEAQANRKKWFAAWQQQYTAPNLEAVLDFHRNAGNGDIENDVVMNRENLVRTVSMTSIVKGAQMLSMRYDDLMTSNPLMYEMAYPNPMVRQGS